MKQLCKCGCGEEVRYPGAQFKHGHHLRLKEYQRKPVERDSLTCAYCRSEFLPKKRSSWAVAQYCSRECSAAARTANGTELVNCLYCDVEMRKRKSVLKEGKGLYCSKDCKYAFERARERPGSYRQNALRTYSQECVDCGYNTHPEILLVHHIDGDRSNGKLDNLAILCPTCHVLRHYEMDGSARVPTYRG